MAAQKPNAAQNGGMGRLPRSVTAVQIVRCRRPVKRNTDEKIVLHKEAAKRIGQQRAVGLQRVGHGDAAYIVHPHRPHKTFVEREPCQQRFAALKRERDAVFGKDKSLADQRLDRGVIHAAAVCRLPVCSLVRIKAIVAAQVARAGNRLQHDINRRHARTSCKEIG